MALHDPSKTLECLKHNSGTKQTRTLENRLISLFADPPKTFSNKHLYEDYAIYKMFI